jgi:hypothetical protein
MKTAFTKTAVTFALAFVACAPAFAESPTTAPEIDNFVSTKSRAEVRAETLVAIDRGQIARNDADATRLAFADFAPSKTRIQVLAEAAEARRLGLIPTGDGQSPIATPEQLEQIRLAGLRTRAPVVAQR